MADLDRAITAAREAVQELDGFKHPELADAYLAHCVGTLRDLLAALDAARGQAVLEIVGGEDGWRGTWEHQPLSEFDVGTKLYAAPTAAQAEPLFLLHTGTVYGNERGDWEVEANSGKAVDAYCDANPGKTVGLYLAQPAAVPPLMDFLLWADGWRETDEHDELTGADAVAYRVAVTIHREMLAATKGSK